MSNQSQALMAKIAEYEEQLAGDPHSRVFIPLAESYRRLGMLDEALDAVNRGLAAHPELPDAQIAAGRILAQRGDLDGALRRFGKVAAGQPGYPVALKGMALVLLRMKRPREAFPLIKQLIQLSPDDPDIEKLKASCQAGMASSMKDAARNSDTPIKTATLADIYVKQGLLHEAVRVYEELLESDPDNATVRQRLAAVKQRMAETPEASAGPESATSQQSPAAAAASAAGPDAAAESDADDAATTTESLLPVFESWLQAIRQRREHVR